MPTLNLNRDKFGGYSMTTTKGSLITIRKTKLGDYYWNIQSPEELQEENRMWLPKVVGKDYDFNGNLVEEQHPSGFSSIHKAAENLCATLGQVYGGVYGYKLNSQFQTGNREGK